MFDEDNKDEKKRHGDDEGVSEDAVAEVLDETDEDDDDEEDTPDATLDDKWE